jgi:hypothetical protein
MAVAAAAGKAVVAAATKLNLLCCCAALHPHLQGHKASGRRDRPAQSRQFTGLHVDYCCCFLHQFTACHANCQHNRKDLMSSAYADQSTRVVHDIWSSLCHPAEHTSAGLPIRLGQVLLPPLLAPVEAAGLEVP